MKSEIVEKVVNALLYEGYLLYPYRKSALKNQHRWNIGIIYPRNMHPSTMTTECLLEGESPVSVDVEIRFLQVESGSSDGTERRARLLSQIDGIHRVRVVFAPLCFELEVSVVKLQEQLRRIRVHIENCTALDDGADPLSLSLVSTHVVLMAREGQFVSLLEPPPSFKEEASNCRNERTWPVLVGQPPDRRCMVSSPIILYDYPRVAAESPGDYFDGAEIDELLTLRVLTLTDLEKQEARESGNHSRRILDRAESLTPEEIFKLHGTAQPVQRTPRRGDRVRLKPRMGADAFDLLLNGKIGVVESVERDFEDRIHVAVVIEDDPGRDLGLLQQPGHRFFFSVDEVEVLT